MLTFAHVSAPNAILEHGRAEEALFFSLWTGDAAARVGTTKSIHMKGGSLQDLQPFAHETSCNHFWLPLHVHTPGPPTASPVHVAFGHTA